jgi:hypothetical protein
VLACAPALTAAAQTGVPEKTATEKSATKNEKSATKKSSSKKSSSAQTKDAPAPLDEVDPDQAVSDTVINVAGWVIASKDNRDLPFAVIDKNAAQVLVFGADGRLRGLAPALIGSAIGDDSAPGVGDRELSDIPLEERTTPAGRYVAGYGPAAGGKSVLWVDYATSVSIHPLESSRSAKKEKRKERLSSPIPEDNRITHGCINVSPAFYSKIIRTTFKDGGVFYVLPDSMSLQAAFPAFEQQGFYAFSREPKKPAKASNKTSSKSSKPAKKPPA